MTNCFGISKYDTWHEALLNVQLLQLIVLLTIGGFSIRND